MSPFIYDRPVPLSLFINRRDELNKIRRFLSRINSGGTGLLAIISPFKHGKTSLIYKNIGYYSEGKF